MSRHAARLDLPLALADPATTLALDEPGWSALLSLARRQRALEKLAHRVHEAGLDGALPARVRAHLLGARQLAWQHRRAARWETGRILAALRDEGGALPCDVVLLKGAAYMVAGLPAGLGRLTSDVDILVPRDALTLVEHRLLAAGWEAVKYDAYDQRYYRQWMHELPPLRHRDRGSTIDVHHNILPEVGRLRPDAAKLLASALPISCYTAHPLSADGRVKVLAARDRLLHTAAHLFQDDDLAGGLRDLLDIDDQIRHPHPADGDLWPGLVARAVEMDLVRPMYYALSLARRILQSPVPDAVLADARDAGGPGRVVGALMAWLTDRAVLPDTGAGPKPGSRPASLLMYLRTHWQRMPLGLLARHLSYKAIRRVVAPPPAQTASQQEKVLLARRPM